MTTPTTPPSGKFALVKGTVGICTPELTKHGLGYIAHLPNEGVRVTVENLQRIRAGLTADIVVAVLVDGAFVTVSSGRLDLSSISQRESWERRLGRRDGESKRWGAVLDGVCAAVLRAERKVDAPAIFLRDVPDPPVLSMALAPLVLANLPTLWFGADGTAKSYAALAAVVSLHTGLRLLGTTPPKTLRTAYVNFEPFAAGEHRSRMCKLLGLPRDTSNADLPDIVYLDCYGSTLMEQAERLQRVMRDERVDFYALDSIGFASDGPLNEDETARRFWQAVGMVGRPMLATGHTAKTGEEVFGSRFWRAGARLAWHITKLDPPVTPTQTAPGLLLRFTCQKSSVEAMPAPVGMRFDFSDPVHVRIGVGSPGRQAQGGMALHERIAGLLRQRRNEPIGYAELALRLGLPDNNVRRAVAEHGDIFEVFEADDGGRAKRVRLRSGSPEGR
ncbi:MAG TPA: AAA family ATPase [Acidimicrobiales bacterium]|nr:AAA family ATPase [Acidimicrobiales bacterium]